MIAALLLASLAAGRSGPHRFSFSFGRWHDTGGQPTSWTCWVRLWPAPVVAAVALPGFGLDAACALVALLAVPAALVLAFGVALALLRRDA